MFEAIITAIGSYLPEKRVSNSYFEEYLETTDDWIVERTGIKERRWALEETTSDLGAKASLIALEKQKIHPESIDLIIVATMSPDYPTPATAALIQSKIGAKNAAGFDVVAACSGFVYAISIAKSFIQSGTYKRILVVGAEKMSSIVDPEDRSTVVLFGDGAGAAVVERRQKESKGFLIEEIQLGLKGELTTSLYIPSGGSISPTSLKTCDEKGHFLKMNGREIFKLAVSKGIELIQALLGSDKKSTQSKQYFLFHQANKRIISAIQERLNIEEKNVISTIEWTANTSAASLPILMDQQPFLVEDELILIAFGAGFTYGGARLKFI